MEVWTFTLWIVTLVLQATILLRGKQNTAFSRFPLFFSYSAYAFSGSLLTLFVYLLRPALYATVFWFYFLVLILAEFAVLMEISDHMFVSFPAIRRLGWLVTIAVAGSFLFLYVAPVLFKGRAPDIALTDFALRVSITKLVIIVLLLASAASNRLRVGRNVSGLLLGFVLYLSVYTAALAGAATFGWDVYDPIIRHVNPLGYFLCVVVWTVTMWKDAPMPEVGRNVDAGDTEIEVLSYHLGRLNSVLTSLLRKP